MQAAAVLLRTTLRLAYDRRYIEPDAPARRTLRRSAGVSCTRHVQATYRLMLPRNSIVLYKIARSQPWSNRSRDAKCYIASITVAEQGGRKRRRATVARPVLGS